MCESRLVEDFSYIGWFQKRRRARGFVLRKLAQCVSCTTSQTARNMIVLQVDDSDALKACALAAYNFLEPSQRRLFESLKLHGGNWPNLNYSAWSGRFKEASHLAKYVTNLQLDFPGSPTCSDIDSFQDVLAYLTNVQRFWIDGTYAKPFICWSKLPPGVSSALLDFIFRQRLRRLDIGFIWMPAVVLSALQTAVPTLRISCAVVERRTFEIPAHAPICGLECLVLQGCTARVHALFSPPNLRGLWVTLRYCMPLISAAAHTLERIRLSCSDLARDDSNHSMFPSLPRLHSFEILINIEDQKTPVFMDILSNILASKSSVGATPLDDLTIGYPFPLLLDHMDDAYRTSLAALEQFLLSYPALARLRWRVRMGSELEGVTALTQEAMPTLHAMGKLGFEQWTYDCFDDDFMSGYAEYRKISTADRYLSHAQLPILRPDAVKMLHTTHNYEKGLGVAVTEGSRQSNAVISKSDARTLGLAADSSTAYCSPPLVVLPDRMNSLELSVTRSESV
ncbi:hypothetical protein C8R44DRAFT_738864 [Mycena epipterygia]|nr:hypothetical protein C8R44DRAFT_738864 [Mycena epipterygia]